MSEEEGKGAENMVKRREWGTAGCACGGTGDGKKKTTD
jgi:hypothetical protein